MISRRVFLASAGVLVAPAIIRTPGLLMPIKSITISPSNVDSMMLPSGVYTGRLTNFLVQCDNAARIMFEVEHGRKYIEMALKITP